MSAASNFEDRVRTRLREAGIRYTAARARVVRLIQGARGPRSAAELRAGVGEDLPLSTLYRTLTVLDEAGVLARSHGADGIARFEPAEWLRGHHHHLVCIECGAVEDVDVGTHDEQLLGAFADKVAGSRGFVPRGHRIDVEGVCGACAA